MTLESALKRPVIELLNIDNFGVISAIDLYTKGLEMGLVTKSDINQRIEKAKGENRNRELGQLATALNNRDNKIMESTPLKARVIFTVELSRSLCSRSL